MPEEDLLRQNRELHVVLLCEFEFSGKLCTH